jgi:probable HAF family extracellular repeat protein
LAFGLRADQPHNWSFIPMRFPSIRLVQLAAWCCGVFALLATAAPVAAQFIRLGHLPGSTFSGVWAISDDGSTVVGAAGFSGRLEAFRWTRATGMVGLGILPGGGGGNGSGAYGVSADGSVVVGGSSSAAGNQAFRWTAASGMVGLGDLPGGGFSGTAWNVSANGLVVVGGSNSATANSEAFRWTQADGMVGLGDLPGGFNFSHAYAASTDGSVIVGEGYSEPGREAFRWTQATGMVGLGDLPGGEFGSIPSDISPDGSVVVGFSTSARGSEPFRWTAAEGMVGLGLLPGSVWGAASAVSADGSIIVGNNGYQIGDNQFQAVPFLWTSATGMRNLQDILVNDLGYNVTGLRLGGAVDISADGRWVVGSAINSSGQTETWLANLAPIPEPSSMALAGLGLAALAGYGWRRSRQETVGSRHQEASCHG